MNKDFEPMTEKLRNKRFANGYFETLAKSGGKGGIVLIICGIILGLIGLIAGALTFMFIKDLINGTAANDTWLAILIFGIPALGLLIGAFFSIRLGVKRMTMNADAWIRSCMKASDYSESIIRDFGEQVIRPDTLLFHLNGKLQGSFGSGFLTKDYILIENLLNLQVIKIADIKSITLASLPDSVKVGNKIKTVHRLNIAIFSNKNTFVVSETKEENAKELTRLLLEKNPQIDTANGRVLNDKEYDALVAEVRKAASKK